MFDIYARTETGHVRSHNEDGFLVIDMVAQSGCHQVSSFEGNLLVAVADGMGGAEAGEVASLLALNQCARMKIPTSSTELQQYLQNHIHKEIVEYGMQHPAAASLGTTLTGLVCSELSAMYFHIGDSRLYRFRDGFIKQLSSDHTWVETVYSLGHITEEERDHHPDKHLLTRCLGGREKSQQCEADVHRVRGKVQVGDLFLLCTDGIYNHLRSEEIEAVFAKGLPLPESVDLIMQLVLDRGAEDNLTALAVLRTA